MFSKALRATYFNPPSLAPLGAGSAEKVSRSSALVQKGLASRG